MQQTLASKRTLCGIGLHSGKPVRLTILPAPADHGLVFRRTDLPRAASDIVVGPENWVEASLCTVLRNAHGATVSTIEHLLAALHGCGVHNARIDIDGPEVPILDGSAAPFVTQILAAGLAPQDAPLRALRVLRAIEVRRGDARARLIPAPELQIAFEIAFDEPLIGEQRVALSMHNGTFLRELSDCRTFCMRADVEMMQANGLALGGTLDNAVVFDRGRVISKGGLRRKDEPVRHKVLDVMGDLYVAGLPILGRYEGFKAGHALSGRVLQELFAAPENYEIITCDPAQAARMPGVGISSINMALSA